MHIIDLNYLQSFQERNKFAVINSKYWIQAVDEKYVLNNMLCELYCMHHKLLKNDLGIIPETMKKK
jgi:hypothetical protein